LVDFARATYRKSEVVELLKGEGGIATLDFRFLPRVVSVLSASLPYL